MRKTIIIGILLVSVIFLQGQAVAEECSSCHKVRHGDDQCLNCHWNATLFSGRHPQKPIVPGSMHGGFDWEGDDHRETNLPPDQESCPACHVNLKDHTSQVVNTCEGCHVEGNVRKASTLNLRNNISSLVPGVYSHFLKSTAIVPPQNNYSSCFGFDASSGEGSCHGVNFMYRNRSGGYFAFNLNYTYTAIRSDIYHWTASADNLPPSVDCTFCHRQEDVAVRKAWGNPEPLPSDSSHNETKDGDCRDCHVEGQFRSFHGKEIVKIKEKSFIPNIISIFLLVLTAILILRWKKQI